VLIQNLELSGGESCETEADERDEEEQERRECAGSSWWVWNHKIFGGIAGIVGC
jgi:hypothetical protein